MIPWQNLDQASIPGSTNILSLHARGEELIINVDGDLLMSSRQHTSEDQLAHMALAMLPEAQRLQARVLIGGLGMGFTLAAALADLGPQGQAVVRELVPAVVTWNEGILGPLAGHPLRDPRTVIEVGDVQAAIRGQTAAWDAVLLDVDNSPRGLTRRSNDGLYDRAGLAAARKALRPGGVLAVWSGERDDAFTQRLKQAGYAVEVRTVRAHGKKGPRHTLWFAQAPR